MITKEQLQCVWMLKLLSICLNPDLAIKLLLLILLSFSIKNGFHIYSTEVKVNQYGCIPGSSFDTIKEFINQYNK